MYSSVFSEVFYRELPSKYDGKAVKSCVDFVLYKLFKHITIAFELLQDEKFKWYAIWASMKREFLR